MNWYPYEFDFIFQTPHFWGIGSSDFSLSGINPTDHAARAHDWVYHHALHSREGRVQRMQADARLARETGFITSSAMIVQSGFRLLTMNYIPLPWD